MKIFALMELDKNMKTHVGQFLDPRGKESEVETKEIQCSLTQAAFILYRSLPWEKLYINSLLWEIWQESKSMTLSPLRDHRGEKQWIIFLCVWRSRPPPPPPRHPRSLSWDSSDQNRRGGCGHVHLFFQQAISFQRGKETVESRGGGAKVWRNIHPQPAASRVLPHISQKSDSGLVCVI